MKEYVVNGLDCADNIICCAIWETEEQAKKYRSYIWKTNKERQKLTRSKVCKVEIVER